MWSFFLIYSYLILLYVICDLQPHLRNVIEYMLQVNKDPDDEVSLEACEFW